MKYLFAAICALALLTLAACHKNEGCGGEFQLSNKWTADERSNILAAMGRFNAWVGKPVILETSDASCTIEPGDCPATEEGCYWPSGDISLDLKQIEKYASTEPVTDCDPSSPCWSNIVVHELGHALGMQHVEDDHSIMSAHPAELEDLDFSTFDRAECQRVGICD